MLLNISKIASRFSMSFRSNFGSNLIKCRHLVTVQHLYKHKQTYERYKHNQRLREKHFIHLGSYKWSETSNQNNNGEYSRLQIYSWSHTYSKSKHKHTVKQPAGNRPKLSPFTWTWYWNIKFKMSQTRGGVPINIHRLLKIWGLKQTDRVDGRFTR